MKASGMRCLACLPGPGQVTFCLEKLDVCQKASWNHHVDLVAWCLKVKIDVEDNRNSHESSENDQTYSSPTSM